jgi:predicted porin
MKKILAVAIATAFAAPAFAATSNVDIYGKLHMSLNWYDDIPTNKSDIGISSNASRIGFKGSEDLGGGLKGVWQIESGLNLDEQNGTLASRNSFVGLSGGFGTALLGNHDTPLKLVGRKVDLFGDTLGDSRNVMGGGSDTRAQNVAAYISPNFSGFSGAFAYTTDLNGTAASGTCVPATFTAPGGVVTDATACTNAVSASAADDDQSAWNLSAQYENGPIYVGFGYGDGDAHEALNLEEHWRLAGAFSFGDFKVVGQYDSLASALNGAANRDYDAWMLGGAFKMGAMTFKANYMDGDFENVSTDPQQFTIGVDYAMSKRTTAYAMYANGEYVTLGKGGGSSDQVSSCATCGGDISALSLGVVHNF